jgi:hypothetical protein
MPLLTAQDDRLLQSWSFYSDPPHYEQDLIQFLKIVYQTMAAQTKIPPSEAQCARIMVTTMLADQLFANYMNACKTHMLTAVWPKFATAVVRYLLDKNWWEIRS